MEANLFQKATPLSAIVGHNLLSLYQNARFGVPVYKYVNSETLEFWTMRNTVKIGTLEEYREYEKQEALENGYGVADPYEGIITDIDEVISSHTGDKIRDRVAKNLEILGLAPSFVTESRFWCKKLTFNNEFAFSSGAMFDKNTFQRWQQNAGYCSVIKIKNVNQFARAVSMADYNSDKALIFPPLIDYARYHELPLNLSKVDLSNGGFIKNSGFGWQHEIRIIWRMRDPSCKYHIVTVPNLDQFIEVMDIPQSWFL